MSCMSCFYHSDDFRFMYGTYTYLAELFSPVSESANRGHLHSATCGDLAVPHSRTTRYGQRYFAVSGPTLWNSLPLSARDPSLTLTQFCARLKTELGPIL